MRIGLVVDHNLSTFIGEISAHLRRSHILVEYSAPDVKAPIFKERLYRHLYPRSLQSLINTSDVTLFEWAAADLAAASQLKLRRPIIARLHSYELYEWALRINWDSVARVVLISQAMQRQFVEVTPSIADRTIVIYHGVDLERFKPSVAKVYQRRIGMMCSIIPIKRVYEMILTLHKLRQLKRDFRLILAGKPGHGSEYRYYVAVRRLTETLGLSNYVDFCGYISDTPEWYRDIDIFVSNSYWEGGQVALMEAMAAGCFCLAHDWNGADEMLPTENRYTTDDELIEKLIRYDALTDEDKLERQAQMRAAAVTRFDIEQTNRNLERLLVAQAGLQPDASVA